MAPVDVSSDSPWAELCLGTGKQKLPCQSRSLRRQKRGAAVRQVGWTAPEESASVLLGSWAKSGIVLRCSFVVMGNYQDSCSLWLAVSRDAFCLNPTAP